MCANKLPRPCTTVRHSCAEPRGCGCSARHTLNDTTTTGIKTALYSTLESLPRMQRLYACETMSIGGPPGGTRAWAGTCTLTSARHWLWSGVGHPSEDTDHTYSRHSHSVSSVVYRSALSDECAAQNSLYGHLGGKTTFEGSSREQCRFGTHTTSSAFKSRGFCHVRVGLLVAAPPCEPAICSRIEGLHLLAWVWGRHTWTGNGNVP